MRLEDAVDEGEGLKKLRRERDADIQRLEAEAEEARNVGENITRWRAELQTEANEVQGEIRLADEKVRRMGNNVKCYADKLDKMHRLLIELRLAG